MRKHRLFTKPTKVADILLDDLNADISSNWENKERLRHRRWYKGHAHRQLFSGKMAVRRQAPWRRGSFGQVQGI
jgi:hypothetical protein